MWKIRDKKCSKKNYRLYSPTSMTAAYMKVKETGAAILTTAREYGVPESSLRHKLSGRVNPEAVRSGPPALFSQEQEAHFADHLKFTASVGYGYSRSEVLNMAHEYAVCLGHRDNDHPLSFQWYTDFMKRWPDLKVLKPRGLQMQRAKATTIDCVANYYTELDRILTKYDLKQKPECIYNVDEKGLSTMHKPPSIVAAVGCKPPAVLSSSRVLVTVIGCGNALGYSVPPFFIFPGLRMRQELLDGKTPGADGDVTESGWSNSEIFKKYLETHLIKYLHERSVDRPVLLLYDGHKSHVSLSLIDWAKKENIILFVLPAHTSHVLQPMDVACFGPFEKIYNGMSHKFMREHCGQSITRYNVCSIACPAYAKALSPENLQSAFRRCGIYPYNPNAVDQTNFKPSEVLQQSEQPPSTNTHSSVISKPSPKSPALLDSQTPPLSKVMDDPVCNFFCLKEKKINEKKTQTKKRKYLSSIISGKALTENDMVCRIHEHISKKAKPVQKKTTKTTKTKKNIKKNTNLPSEPQPGPSGLSKESKKRCTLVDLEESSSCPTSSGDESDKCCVCGKFTPDEVRQSVSLIFTKWVACDGNGCDHWVHLNCSKVSVIRRGDKFYCPHCSAEE